MKINYGRTEADEQKAVIQWCILMEKRWPELEYLYHVPNGGSRNCTEKDERVGINND